MSIVFSDTSANQGIVQQARAMMRVDASQWPTARIVSSVNNYLDKVAGYAIAADRRFQWDDTNHTKLPIGTTNLVANQADYSFLTDEQGNSIITLTRVELLDSNGTYRVLEPIDQSDITLAIDTEQATTGTPTCYDKIADNIVRLYPKPSTSVTSGLKFYFQRSPSYFAATDTTKSPGVAPMLHRGFVIAAAYDGALTLGLANINALAAEKLMEEQNMVRYFTERSRDERSRLGMAPISFR